MITDSQLQERYKDTSSGNLRDIILSHNMESELAAYYLLRHRMKDKLEGVCHKMNISEPIYDILMDFYLYLRDGKGGRNSQPFQGIEGLRSWLAFESWIIRTFSNFLVDRIALQEKKDTVKDELSRNCPESYDYARDRKIELFAILLAKAQDVFVPRDLFIFYRSILSILDKDRLISNEQMAEAMGISYANYRQISTRTKQMATCALAQFEQAKSIRISPNDKKILDRVNNDFEKLFEVITELYDQTLDQLACKTAVVNLRKKDLQPQMVYDNDVKYSLKAGRKHNSSEFVLNFRIDADDVNKHLFRWNPDLYNEYRTRKFYIEENYLYPTPDGDIYFRLGDLLE